MDHWRTPYRLVATILCAITACATWKPLPYPPADVLSEPRKHVRLTLADSTQHAVDLARIEGDSVVGVRPRPTPTRLNRVAFPLADVSRIEVSESDSRRTLLWIAGVSVGILIYCAIVCPPEL